MVMEFNQTYCFRWLEAFLASGCEPLNIFSPEIFTEQDLAEARASMETLKDRTPQRQHSFSSHLVYYSNGSNFILQDQYSYLLARV